MKLLKYYGFIRNEVEECDEDKMYSNFWVYPYWNKITKMPKTARNLAQTIQVPIICDCVFAKAWPALYKRLVQKKNWDKYLPLQIFIRVWPVSKKPTKAEIPRGYAVVRAEYDSNTYFGSFIFSIGKQPLRFDFTDPYQDLWDAAKGCKYRWLLIKMDLLKKGKK